MAKRKLTPQKREVLRNELTAKLAAGVEKREILSSLSAKYGITPEGMRWYLNAASPNGSVKKGRPAKGRRPGKKPGPKASRGTRARKARAPRAASRGRTLQLAEVLGQLTEKALKGLLAARRLVPALEASQEREQELRTRQRNLSRELRAERVKARKIQRAIKRLASR